MNPYFFVGAMVMLVLEAAVVLAARAVGGLSAYLIRTTGVTVKWRGALTDRDKQAAPVGLWWERRRLLFHAGHWYREYKGPVVGRWWGIGLARRFGVTIIRTVDL